MQQHMVYVHMEHLVASVTGVGAAHIMVKHAMA